MAGVTQDGLADGVKFHSKVKSRRIKFQGNNEDFNWFHGKWNCLDFPACCSAPLHHSALNWAQRLVDAGGGGLDALLSLGSRMTTVMAAWHRQEGWGYPLSFHRFTEATPAF